MIIGTNLALTPEGGIAVLEVAVGRGTRPPPPPGPTELEDYLAYLEDKYEDVYNQLQQAGLTEATKRIFAVNQDTFEEDYNIEFKTINF